jgi:hypothetical protein
MEAPSTDVGTRVLFENEVVRVWDFRLEPGEASQLHRHLHDYLFVYVTEHNELEVRAPDQQPLRVSTPDGYVSYTRVGSASDPRLTHQLVNVGDTPHRQILVELLTSSGEGPARSVSNQAGSDAWAEERAR